eukprot:6199337-Pleurochrysis_carterae.AAC.1
MRARGEQKLGARSAKRSASTHAARAQNGELCIRAQNSGAWQRFHVLYFAIRPNWDTGAIEFYGNEAIMLINSENLKPLSLRAVVI